MLHSFTCQNFYSFSHPSTIKFNVNDKAPESDKYFTSPFGVRLSKAQTVIGPNASGKTNLLRVLPFVKWMIVDSFKADPDTSIPFKPYIFTSKKNQTTSLEVEFEIDKSVYIYELEFDSQKIYQEKLSIKNKTKQKVTTKYLFTREYSDKLGGYAILDKKFNLLKKSIETEPRTNSSLISLGYHLNHDYSKKIVEYWQKVHSNVIETGWSANMAENIGRASVFYLKNKEVKTSVEKILSKFDLDLIEFDIKIIKEDNSKLNIDIAGQHQIGKQKYELPFHYESSGTKRLYSLLYSILQVLDNGGIAIIDEIDASLHPDIVIALYEMFISPRSNPHNAQLLFSTHSLQILGLLDKYEINLVEKDQKRSTSEVWRLDEMEGVRSDDNYYTKYMAGTYGAVPDIK